MPLTPEQIVWHTVLMQMLDCADINTVQALEVAAKAADSFRERFPQDAPLNQANAQVMQQQFHGNLQSGFGRNPRNLSDS